MTLQELLDSPCEYNGPPFNCSRELLLEKSTPDTLRWHILKRQWAILRAERGEEEANERVANSLKAIENVKNGKPTLWHITPKGLEGPDELKASLSAADYRATVDELRQVRGLKPKGGEWAEI